MNTQSVNLVVGTSHRYKKMVVRYCHRCGDRAVVQKSQADWWIRNNHLPTCRLCANTRTNSERIELPRLPDTWWAWLAGFFDGEGYCNVHHGANDNQARIQISNTDKRPLFEICERLGYGSVTTQDKSKQNLNWNRCWYWGVTNAYGILWTLDNMQPYLRVRDNRLKLVVEHYSKRIVYDPIHKFIKEEIRNV